MWVNYKDLTVLPGSFLWGIIPQMDDHSFSNLPVNEELPSGKLSRNYGKSRFSSWRIPLFHYFYGHVLVRKLLVYQAGY